MNKFEKPYILVLLLPLIVGCQPTGGSSSTADASESTDLDPSLETAAQAASSSGVVGEVASLLEDGELGAAENRLLEAVETEAGPEAVERVEGALLQVSKASSCNEAIRNVTQAINAIDAARPDLSGTALNEASQARNWAGVASWRLLWRRDASYAVRKARTHTSRAADIAAGICDRNPRASECDAGGYLLIALWKLIFTSGTECS